MKNTRRILLALVIMIMASSAFAQSDTMPVVQPDTTKLTVQKDSGKKEKKKKKDHFIPYAGVSFSHLVVPASTYKSVIAPGYMLGFDYKRGRFFYWQIGARFNNAIYYLEDITLNADSTDNDDIFGVRDIDLPVTVGINFLYFTDRLLGLRLFVSAMPAYVFNIGDNRFGYTNDDLNSFNIFGQLGIGLDIAFLAINVGYNFGFMDMFDKDFESKPGQLYLTLGFRF